MASNNLWITSDVCFRCFSIFNKYGQQPTGEKGFDVFEDTFMYVFLWVLECYDDKKKRCQERINFFDKKKSLKTKQEIEIPFFLTSLAHHNLIHIFNREKKSQPTNITEMEFSNHEFFIFVLSQFSHKQTSGGKGTFFYC